MKELTVVMPVYNEAEIIHKVIESWLAVLRGMKIDFSIMAINDGSKDNTLRILKKVADENAEVQIVDKENSGHGPSILKGYREAHADWVFQVDSDDEIDAKYFNLFWDSRSDYDLIIGDRYGRRGPLSRRLVTVISRFTIRLLYGSGIKDVNCPYRLYRTEEFQDVFDCMASNTFAPNVILSGYAIMSKLRILKIPIFYKFRTTGEVSIKKIKLFKAAALSFVQTIAFRLSPVLRRSF